MKLILKIYFNSIYPKYDHVNMQSVLKIEVFYISFFSPALRLQNLVCICIYSTFWPHFKCSLVSHGQWPLYGTVQVSRLDGCISTYRSFTASLVLLLAGPDQSHLGLSLLVYPMSSVSCAYVFFSTFPASKHFEDTLPTLEHIFLSLQTLLDKG